MCMRNSGRIVSARFIRICARKSRDSAAHSSPEETIEDSKSVLWCSAVLNFDLVIEIYFFKFLNQALSPPEFPGCILRGL